MTWAMAPSALGSQPPAVGDTRKVYAVSENSNAFFQWSRWPEKLDPADYFGGVFCLGE
jgi:hypothetical protein